MRLLSITLITGALAVGSSIALAADAKFAAADRDGNGLLSMAEVILALPDATPEAFNSADSDENGALTEAEFVTAVADGVLPEG
jgi:hypothetical protein